MKFRLIALVAVLLVALVPTGAGVARTRTTEPTEIIRINVTLTDTKLTLSRKSADRGTQVDFWVRNLGRRPHDFTFEAEGAAALSAQGFSTGAVKPHGKAVVLQLFMDYRGRFEVLSALPADKNKPRMKTIFTIT
jgi:hypothetical protein